MPSFLKKLVISILLPNDELAEKGWTIAQLSTWIKNGQGSFLTSLSDETTHLVISRAQWRQYGETVATAFATKERSRGGLPNVVDMAWLELSLYEQKARAAKYHLWEKLEPRQSKSGTKVNREETASTKGKGTVSMMAEVFAESTSGFLSEKEKDATNAQIEEAQAAAQAKTEELAQKREAAKALFDRGVRKARNELFQENYHIYADQTGFHYEVMLVKADAQTNTNQRIALTIYESNSEPHLYAVNSQRAATRTAPQNEVLAAVGCPFPTAFRAFREAFEYFTSVNWDERIEASARDRAGAGNSVKPRGVKPGERPFKYFPPPFGPVGRVPEVLVDASAPTGAETGAVSGRDPPLAKQDIWPLAVPEGRTRVELSEQDRVISRATGASITGHAGVDEAPGDFGHSIQHIPSFAKSARQDAIEQSPSQHTMKTNPAAGIAQSSDTERYMFPPVGEVGSACKAGIEYTFQQDQSRLGTDMDAVAELQAMIEGPTYPPLTGSDFVPTGTDDMTAHLPLPGDWGCTSAEQGPDTSTPHALPDCFHDIYDFCNPSHPENQDVEIQPSKVAQGSDIGTGGENPTSLGKRFLEDGDEEPNKRQTTETVSEPLSSF